MVTISSSTQIYNPETYDNNVIEDVTVGDGLRLYPDTHETFVFTVEENVVNSEHKFFDLGFFSE